MNEAHSHLIINHFPIIGILFGILVLLIGIIAKSSVTRRVGLFLFLIAGITAFPSFKTGEGAEHEVEEYAENTMKKAGVYTPDQIGEAHEAQEHYIHEHEEKAESFMLFVWGIVGLSLIALFLEWKKKSMAIVASIVVLVLGCLAAYFANEVGNSGGQISHPEIRNEKMNISGNNHSDHAQDED